MAQSRTGLRAVMRVGLIVALSGWSLVHAGQLPSTSPLTEPMMVEITGEKPYGHAILQATEVALQQRMQFAPRKMIWLDRMILPQEDVRRVKSAWATALVCTGGVVSFEEQQAPVRVTAVSLENVATTTLCVSNYPETVYRPRILLEAALPSDTPMRLLYHHKNGSGNALTFVVEMINPSDAPAQVQIIDATAGPSMQEGEVGHQAAWQFANRESRNSGYVTTVPPHTVLSSAHIACPSRATISGLARFRMLTPGRQLIVRVRAVSGYAPSSTAPYVPSAVLGDYQYPTAEITYRGTYVVHSNWLFVPLGGVAMPAARPGQELQGSYGVWHRYELTTVNPEDRAVTVQLVAIASGGPARLVYSLGGAWRQSEVLHPDHEQVLTSFILKAGARQTILFSSMPESGSNYPIKFMLRSPG